MSYCPNCGAAVGSEVRFCETCGQGVNQGAGEVAPPVANPVARMGEVSQQSQGQYSADGKWWWNGAQWMAVTLAPGEVPVARLAARDPYWSKDGQWHWDGTQWVSVEAIYRLSDEPQLSPDGQWLFDGTNWIPNPAIFAATTVRAKATPTIAKAKPKRGGAKLIVPALILAGAFALGWFLWPYELLIAAVGAGIAGLAWWNPRGIGTSIKVAASKLKLPGMQPSRSGQAAAGLLVLSLVLFPVGAGALGQYVGGQVANSPKPVSLYGTAFLSTPLTGASVNVYELGSNGKQGTRLGTATTDSNGYWNMDVSRHPRGTLLVATSGGSYIDEISKKPVTTTPNDSLKTVLIPEFSYAQLTPLTTFAASRTVPMIASGTPAKMAWVAAYFTVARQYNLDINTLGFVTPTISNNPQDVLSTTRDARQEGLILAGLDQEAATLGTSEFALTDAIASDLSDGILDGKQDATPILLDRGAALDKDAGTGGLQKGINQVAAAPGFDNHIPTPQVLLSPINIALNGAGIFPATTALPAFVNGRGASVALAGRNGTKPYYCEPASGLPDGFSLSNSCVLRYDGTDILGAGGGSSVLRMLPAFNVTMTDASSPKQSVTFNLIITVTQKPPEVTGVGGTCPQATKPCTLTIMSVKGGTPPYTYSKQCCDSLPLGMFLDLFKPILSGKPAKAGTYTATVCATDLVGSQGCGPVTVVVENGPSPSPQASEVTPGLATIYLHWNCHSNDPGGWCQNNASPKLLAAGGTGDALDGAYRGLSADGCQQAARSNNLTYSVPGRADSWNGGGIWWCSMSSNPKDLGP